MDNRAGRAALIFVAGLVVGVVAIGLLRLALMPDHATTHFHANWAVYVDGQRLDLSDERYMEDVVRCKANPEQLDPEDRVHMHNGNHDVVHVHDRGVTWGHFLANLGFGVGDHYLATRTGELHRNSAERSLKFILNGEEVSSIRNQLIESTDRLLISHGPESVDEVLRTQFASVADDAARFNEMPDPAGCSGNTHDPMERLRRAFWF